MANYYKPYFKDDSSLTLDGKCTNVKIENGICRFVDYHGTILAITPLTPSSILHPFILQ